MGHSCDAVEEQKSHADGEVFEILHSFYSLEQLEGMHLWQNMALEAHVTGMNCAAQ